MLSYNAHQRPTAKQIINHPYFASIHNPNCPENNKQVSENHLSTQNSSFMKPHNHIPNILNKKLKLNWESSSKNLDLSRERSVPQK